MSRRLLTYSNWCAKRFLYRQTLCFVSIQKNPSTFPKKIHSHVVRKKEVVNTIYPGRSDDAASCDLDEAEKDNSVLNIIDYDKTDPVINSLLSASTVQDVLNTLSSNQDNLKKEYLVQSALILWHLQNVFVKIQSQLEVITDVTEAEYVVKLKSEPQFVNLLQNIEKSVGVFNIDELTCSLLYLSKMEVDCKSSVIQLLLGEIERKFKNDPNCASLSAISRTCVALKHNQELWCQFSLLNLVPLITSKIDQVTNPEDLRLLTICLMYTHHLLTPDVFAKYKKLCEKFLNENILTNSHGKTITKMLTFLSLSFWAYQNNEIMHKLGYLLKGKINQLDPKYVISLYKSFLTYLEPAELMQEIAQVAKDYLQSEPNYWDKNVKIGMLMAVARFSSHDEKINLANYLRRELDSDYFLYNMISFFQILRSLKTSDHKLCHVYWSKAIDTIQRQSLDGELYGLLRVAHRYMYFNNNMGGTYRHYRLEKQMIEWIVNEIENGSMGLYPYRLARGVSFIIAYCTNPRILIPAMEKLIKMGPQLTHLDCVVVSRGVEIMLDLMRKKQFHTDVMEKLVELDTCLNRCAWRHLESDNLNIMVLNNLLRTYHNRRASPESLLIDTILKRLSDSKENLSSRIVQEISYCSAGLSYLAVDLMDRIVDFVGNNGNELMAETAERALSTMFYLGYNPKSPEFFKICSQLLKRDLERLPCLSIIQTCLALCYYQQFPPDLVGTIFSVEFLDRIDQELASCYSKASYPVKVRYSLMELNRSVCLDLPELDVPWFHSKYCDEIKALDPQIVSGFHVDVGNQLSNILNDNSYVQTNVYSPYGYKINFLVLLDQMTKPLHRSEEKLAKQRVAFILHSDKQFTIGERRLKGPQQLRQRHLEMLGYRVVPISEFTWNAMYLTEVEAKRRFLADKLWPER